MLLANRKVAEFIGKQNLPFVYRVHDEPDPDKLQTFSEFLKKFGYDIQTSSRKKTATSMNQVLADVHGKEEANMIETLAIRTMAKLLTPPKTLVITGWLLRIIRISLLLLEDILMLLFIVYCNTI